MAFREFYGSVQRRNRVMGVTLIELLVTVAVLAILATVAFPSFIDMLQRNRISGVAQNIYAELQRARAAAIKLDAPVYVYSGPSGASWCVALSSVVSGCDCDSCTLNENGVAQSYVVRAEDYPNVSLVPPVENGTFGFDPDLGMVTPSSSGLFQFTLDSMALNVQFSRLGRFNICYPNGGSAVMGYEECAP